jgi:hypothetical protein
VGGEAYANVSHLRKLPKLSESAVNFKLTDGRRRSSRDCYVVIAESYQNYQNGAVSNQLKDNGRGIWWG